jgi:hypothetical protein
MSQYNFGVGKLTLITPTTPAQAIDIGVVKDVSMDISFTTKELRGAYQFPVDVARAGGKISGKAKYGQINGGIVSAILNTTKSTGSKIGVAGETAAVPGTPYQITVANSANWLDDLGVFDNTTGLYLTRVSSAPATGQYSVAAGVYTFAAADTTHSMSISYSYTSAATGQTNALVNALMGTSTVYQLTLFNSFRGKNIGLKLYAATIPKLSFAFKNEDYTEQDLDFECFADSSGRVIDFYTTE